MRGIQIQFKSWHQLCPHSLSLSLNAFQSLSSVTSSSLALAYSAGAKTLAIKDIRAFREVLIENCLRLGEVLTRNGSPACT